MRRLTLAIKGDDDGQADGYFGGGDGDDEENEDLRVVIGQSIKSSETGKGDERKVGGIQHQFQGHENDENIAAQHDASEADSEKHTANEQILIKRDHGLFQLPLAKDDDANGGDQNEDSDNLKGQVKAGEQSVANVPDVGFIALCENRKVGFAHFKTDDNFPDHQAEDCDHRHRGESGGKLEFAAFLGFQVEQHDDE